MSEAKPYGPADIEWLRSHPSNDGSIRIIESRWLATVDALTARVETLERERGALKAVVEIVAAYHDDGFGFYGELSGSDVMAARTALLAVAKGE